MDAKTIFELLKTKGKMLVTAESCTGGMIAMQLTELAGSSEVFERGFVTYSNQAKMDCLGVPPQTLDSFGAVSADTAEEMAFGALRNSLADLAVSVTGIAGPSGGTVDKPVGLVFIGVAGRDMPVLVNKYVFSGDRSKVREQAVKAAFKQISDYL
ncbi:MAG: damage-inducible protein CinA [Micavibrio sp.]|nr:damage-inducible protein CinA [Micavibrio sp.]